jgi:hypothetical protein
VAVVVGADAAAEAGRKPVAAVAVAAVVRRPERAQRVRCSVHSVGRQFVQRLAVVARVVVFAPWVVAAVAARVVNRTA